MVEYPGEGYRQSHWGLLRHHCHYTVASADSKFDDLSDTGIDSIIDFTIPKNTKKATTGEYLFWKETEHNLFRASTTRAYFVGLW